MKRENDVELMRGNEDALSIKSEHSWNELQGFSLSEEDHENDVELSFSSNSAINEERGTVAPTVFVDTDAFVISVRTQVWKHE